MEKRLKKIVHEAGENGEIAGLNVLILKDQREIFYEQAGFANIEERKPITRDTIFRLYSMTKPVTATAAMLLAERGVLDLGQPVSEILTGFCDQKVCDGEKLVPLERPLLVKNLLNMTSGLVYPGTQTLAERQVAEVFDDVIQNLYGNHPLTTLEVADRIGKCPLQFQPEELWQYSSSADVLGAVIETVSGMKFGEFLKSEFFEPLGMKDTGFYVPANQKARVAVPYERMEKGKFKRYTGYNLGISNDVSLPNAYESGGAGLVSTIDDYARFAQMLLNGGNYGGTQILQKRTVKYLTQGSLSERQKEGMKNWIELSGHTYGNLMRILEEPEKATSFGKKGEYGWDGWLGCYFSNCPSENMTILAMLQLKDSGIQPVIRKIRNVVFSSEI